MKDEYPKQMIHPNFSPAVLSDDNAAGRFRDAPPGRPAQFPPVTVSNADQEEYHASRGYVPSNGKVHIAAPINPRRYRERENIRMKQAEEPEVPETYEYPKWVGNKIAKDAKEERAILSEMSTPAEALKIASDYIDPAEMDEFRAWKAAKARGTEKREPVKRKKQEMTPERLQQMRENLAKARAKRGLAKNAEAAAGK